MRLQSARMTLYEMFNFSSEGRVQNYRSILALLVLLLLKPLAKDEAACRAVRCWIIYLRYAVYKKNDLG